MLKPLVLDGVCRFQRSKVVTGGLKLRFYMGAPLVASNGHRIGVL
jgi:hypothetical protein